MPSQAAGTASLAAPSLRPYAEEVDSGTAFSPALPRQTTSTRAFRHAPRGTSYEPRTTTAVT
jgi:hypothetical protein